MELSHASFSIGSHMDRDKNQSDYVKHHTLSKDGMLFFNMSQAPMKYDKMPLNIQLSLQIKSPLVFDITCEETGKCLVGDIPDNHSYSQKGYEIHQIMF